jgi:hypothetical protein
MEFYFNDTLKAETDVLEIPAGTFVVMPSAQVLDGEMKDEVENTEMETLPEYLIVCAGQKLKRELYPGWSAPYEGGFYDFDLPDLVNKFILGFDPDGNAIMGTGCVYYKSLPIELEIP